MWEMQSHRHGYLAALLQLPVLEPSSDHNGQSEKRYWGPGCDSEEERYWAVSVTLAALSFSILKNKGDVARPDGHKVLSGSNSLWFWNKAGTLRTSS